jgi:hypothetical protein
VTLTRAHDERSCPTAFGCLCSCPACIEQHCGPAHRAAFRFCLSQGIVPTDAAVRAAVALLAEAAKQERAVPCAT